MIVPLRQSETVPRLRVHPSEGMRQRAGLGPGTASDRDLRLLTSWLGICVTANFIWRMT